eukprot:1948975-Rhodomonas_salina.2
MDARNSTDTRTPEHPAELWCRGQELDEIRKARQYGAHLTPGEANEGAFQFRRQRMEGKDTASGNKILEYAGGDTYDGEVHEGLKHGLGKYTWANGARLFGISTLDIHASCVASNHRYEGEWRKNVPHGTGKYSWPDGESYEGRFKKGRRDGSGIYVFANGASFVGIFRDDLGELYDQAMRCPMLTQRMATAHGKGICTLPGGRCFHGEFSLFAAYLRTTQVQLCTTPANPPFAGLWSSTMKSGQNDHAATESANHANLFGLAGPKQ